MEKYEENKWNNYQLLVLQQLEDHNDLMKTLSKDLHAVKETIAGLQANVEVIKDRNVLDPTIGLIREQITKVENVLANLKETYQINEAGAQVWKTQTNERLEVIEDDIQYIFYDENGAERRLQVVERNHDVEQQLRSASKAQWALYISIIISVLNIVAHLVSPLVSPLFKN